MTKVHLTEENKAHISAVLDSEEALSELMTTSEAGKQFERYSLIGDVMRNDASDVIHIDIADSVAELLEHEPVFADFKQTQLEPESKATESKLPDNVVPFNWKKPVSQIAIAASVAVFAIMGVQTLPSGDAPGVAEPAPMFQTKPFGGIAAPVSYSSEPALDNATNGLRKLQQQRIGALVLEHQRQTRIATQETPDKNNILPVEEEK